MDREHAREALNEGRYAILEELGEGKTGAPPRRCSGGV